MREQSVAGLLSPPQKRPVKEASSWLATSNVTEAELLCLGQSEDKYMNHLLSSGSGTRQQGRATTKASKS